LAGYIVLRIEPQDKDATQTKLYLLLQTEKYEDALALVDVDAERVYEKAYTLYRLQREDEVKSVLESTKAKDEDHRGASHLEAQIVSSVAMLLRATYSGYSTLLQAYRTGDYQTAVDIYTELLDTAEPVGSSVPSLRCC
jgi:signal recognition particle subunit SRP72